MNTTPALTAQIAAFKRADRDRLAANIGDPNGSYQLRRVLTDGLATITAVQARMDAADAIVYADAWHDVATTLRARREVESANYADALAVLLTTWAVQMGDIGEPLTTEEGDEEPLTVPTEWPAPVEVPA